MSVLERRCSHWPAPAQNIVQIPLICGFDRMTYGILRNRVWWRTSYVYGIVFIFPTQWRHNPFRNIHRQTYYVPVLWSALSQTQTYKVSQSVYLACAYYTEFQSYTIFQVQILRHQLHWIASGKTRSKKCVRIIQHSNIQPHPKSFWMDPRRSLKRSDYVEKSWYKIKEKILHPNRNNE